MSSVPTIEEIIADRRSAFSTHCIGLAALTLYFYDYFASLEAELTLVWGRGWTLGKILFIMLRYLTAFDVIIGNYVDDVWWSNPDGYEPIAFPMSVVGNVFALVVPYTQLGVFFLCIYCLLGAKRKWKITFIIIFILMAAFSATLMLNHLIRIAIKISDTSIFRVIGNYWVFVRNLIIFLIGSAAIFHRYRETIKTTSTYGRVSLLEVVRRDGLFYYLGVLATNLWACIFFTPGFPAEIRAVAYSGSIGRVLSSILACRMIINLRKTSQEPETRGVVSSMQFELHDRIATKSDGTEKTVVSQGDSTLAKSFNSRSSVK